jgi:hypothetical protein
MAAKTPLEQLLSNYWGSDPETLLSVIEQRLGLRVDARQLIEARDVSSFATALKHQVDHPGRLERLAERLLQAGGETRQEAAKSTTW